MIITLKEAIGYTNDMVEHLLEKDHARLIKGPSKTNITKWLSDWNSLSAQAIAIQSPGLSEHRLCRDFVRSTHNSNDLFYANYGMQVTLENVTKRVITIPILTSRYLETMGMAPISKPYLGSFATLGEPEENTDRKTTPKCVCKRRHKWDDCFILNEKKRPQDYKPSRGV